LLRVSVDLLDLVCEIFKSRYVAEVGHYQVVLHLFAQGVARLTHLVAHLLRERLCLPRGNRKAWPPIARSPPGRDARPKIALARYGEENEQAHNAQRYPGGHPRKHPSQGTSLGRAVATPAATLLI